MGFRIFLSFLISFFCECEVRANPITESNTGRCRFGEKTDFLKNIKGVCGQFENLKLTREIWDKIDVSGSKYSLVTFDRLEVQNSNFLLGSLQESILNSANVIDSNFNSASLRGATVRNSIFSKMEWELADLRGARIETSSFNAINFKKSQWSGSTILKSQFVKCDFRGADLRDAVITLTRFTDSIYDAKTQLPFSESFAKSVGFRRVDP